MYAILLYKTYIYYVCNIEIKILWKSPHACALVKDPHTEYETWCQKWDLVSKDLGSMDIEAMDINAMDMISCSLDMKIV